jgi:transketolase
VVMDHNKVQSDKPICEIVNLGNVEEKFRSFGWHVARCDGHDYEALGKVFREFRCIKNVPKILIADTIKGRGVSFMEHPQALKDGGGYYKWHAGAPADDKYLAGRQEIVDRINAGFAKHKLGVVKLVEIETEPAKETPKQLQGEPESRGSAKASIKATAEFVADAYGKALVEVAARRKDVVVLDADLAADCRVREFELTYPDRFIECGIAEQDMVSMAGGLARQGLLPVVNSFASFLASRSNEQIYNNAGEKTKIIYICHYAGLIPAGPGKSHQSIRDISLFGALPNCVILQPCNPAETKMVLDHAVETATENVMIRLVIGPSPEKIDLPKEYCLRPGQGVSLTEGKDALIFAYGPVMLHEAMQASKILVQEKFGLKVVNMPWLNRIDHKWLKSVVPPFKKLFVLEDHAPVGGLGDRLLEALNAEELLPGREFKVFGVEGYPACGTPLEALKYHSLDGASLAGRIRRNA